MNSANAAVEVRNTIGRVSYKTPNVLLNFIEFSHFFFIPLNVLDLIDGSVTVSLNVLGNVISTLL